jgi:hypothetical protein
MDLLQNRKAEVKLNLMIKHYYLLILLSTMLQNCSMHKPQFPGVPFERNVALDGTGFNQQRQDSLTNYLEKSLETTGMVILKDGKTVFEYGDLEEIGHNASVRKSILSILLRKIC